MKLATLLLATTSLSAQAQTAPVWPSAPVRIINNFPAGGPSDILSRALADGLQRASGKSVIVENKPGAGGNIGAVEVARAAADGNTVFCGIDTAFTVNPHIFPNIAFKLGQGAGDLKPLVVIASNGLLLGTPSAKPFRTLPDLVAHGKTSGLNFSSGGAGSPGHLGVALFSQATHVKVTHVPYKGNSPAVAAIVAGEVDGGILSSSGLLPQVKAGKVTAIAVTSRARSKLAPEVPTVSELGFAELENEVISLCMVPGGVPEPLLVDMQKAALAVLAQPALRERITGMDMEYEGLIGSAATKRLTDLSTRYAKVVKATGMKVE